MTGLEAIKYLKCLLPHSKCIAKESVEMAITALSNMDKMRKQVEALKSSDLGKEYSASDIVHWAEQFLK